MKKKLLIVSHALELGGAERSLIGLLNAFDFEKYDVDLFLLRHEVQITLKRNASSATAERLFHF